MFTLYEGKRYRVRTFQGGIACEIVRKQDGASVHMQGDESTDFLQECESAEAGRIGGVDDLCADYDHIMRV